MFHLKNLLFVILCFVFEVISFEGFAKESDICFIVKENDKILKITGECEKRYPPQSTFKIALSLMGFDSKVLLSEDSPNWDLPKKADYYINVCKDTHNPKTWMRDSCLWFSEIIANKIGFENLKKYVNEFNYGNMDVSAGLPNFWVSSSLKISPIEQMDFLEKIINHKLNISLYSFEKTKNIMFIQELHGGWMLYGKTGNGNLVLDDGKKIDLQQGWFMGYIEKGARKIMFVGHIVDNEKNDVFASFRIKNYVINQLWYLTNGDELK
jgi:beta-lactamase class D